MNFTIAKYSIVPVTVVIFIFFGQLALLMLLVTLFKDNLIKAILYHSVVHLEVNL